MYRTVAESQKMLDIRAIRSALNKLDMTFGIVFNLGEIQKPEMQRLLTEMNDNIEEFKVLQTDLEELQKQEEGSKVGQTIQYNSRPPPVGPPMSRSYTGRNEINALESEEKQAIGPPMVRSITGRNETTNITSPSLTRTITGANDIEETPRNIKPVGGRRSKHRKIRRRRTHRRNR